jgi:hypothetical protein
MKVKATGAQLWEGSMNRRRASQDTGPAATDPEGGNEYGLQINSISTWQASSNEGVNPHRLSGAYTFSGSWY